VLCCAGQLREELSNARGINDLTADETTKLLLENSHMQQVRAWWWWWWWWWCLVGAGGWGWGELGPGEAWEAELCAGTLLVDSSQHVTSVEQVLFSTPGC
jgi:hypothetical protein